MPEILIRRCTLRLIRRSGWSWGPQPRRIAQDAARALPELLAKKLAGMFPDDDEEHEMAAPLRVRIPLRWSEFETALIPPASGSASGSIQFSASLDQKVDSALRAALGIPCPAPAPPSPVEDPLAARFGEHTRTSGTGETGALARLLASWHEQGTLERRLLALPSGELEIWHSFFADHPRAAAVAPLPDGPVLEQIEDFIASRVRASSGVHFDPVRCRILIATETAARFSMPLAHPAVWKTLDRFVPIGGTHEIMAGVPTRSSGTLRPAQSVPPSIESTDRPQGNSPLTQPALQPQNKRQPDEWSVKIDCALPFLILGTLSRLGYFSALQAALEANQLSREASLFACALAYKVLDPPERGWRRTPASAAAAAALAASQQPIAEELLSDFCRRMAPHTAALDLPLTDAIVAGHTKGEPVTLFPAEDILVLDSEGCFPICWTHGFESLRAILDRLASPIVLIPEEAASADLFRDLNQAGVSFVTAVLPARGDHWQRIHPGREWTNSSGPLTEPLRRAASMLPTAADEAGNLVHDLSRARPGVVRPSSFDLDRSLTLAASVALGMIAWKLWKSRGRTTPQQVLERFTDLECRVQFTPSMVKVDLPLGRRHQELQDNGLLASVDGIPWLGKRRVEFGKG